MKQPRKLKDLLLQKGYKIHEYPKAYKLYNETVANLRRKYKSLRMTDDDWNAFLQELGQWARGNRW